MISRGRIAVLVAALAAAARVAAAQTADASVQLTEVRVGSRGGALAVEIRTSGRPTYRSEFMDGPFRLVLDFEGAAYRWTTTPVAVGAGPVKEIRGSQYRKGIARVVIELTRRTPYALEPHAEGLRVVFGTAPAPPDAAPRFKLQGIVLRDEGSVAYVADTTTNTVGAYRVGDRLGDAVVETIEERRLVLRTPAGTADMRLADPRPPKPAAAPGPPR